MVRCILALGSPRDVKLDPGKSTTLRFRFRVPDSVADGATAGASVDVGQNPSVFFRPVGTSLVAYFSKGNIGFTLMSVQEAQRYHSNRISRVSLVPSAYR